MANNKVELSNGTVLIDLTSDTVTADKLMQGYTAHDHTGAQIIGTASGGGEECDMYAGKNAPSGAVNGDLWVDTSDDAGEWPPETINAGDTPVLQSSVYLDSAKSTTNLAATNVKITITKAGTYRFKWFLLGFMSGYGVTGRLYKNNTAVGTQQTSEGAMSCTLDLACNAGDTICLYLKGMTYWTDIVGSGGGLIACIDGDNGF